MYTQTSYCLYQIWIVTYCNSTHLDASRNMYVKYAALIMLYANYVTPGICYPAWRQRVFLCFLLWREEKKKPLPAPVCFFVANAPVNPKIIFNISRPKYWKNGTTCRQSFLFKKSWQAVGTIAEKMVLLCLIWVYLKGVWKASHNLDRRDFIIQMHKMCRLKIVASSI